MRMEGVHSESLRAGSGHIVSVDGHLVIHRNFTDVFPASAGMGLE